MVMPLQRAKKSIVENLDIPKEVVMNVPKVTIVSNEDILIENHQGIILFTDNLVRIKSSMGTLSINGEKFEILFMGGKTIALSGKLKAVEYEGNE